MKFLCCWCFERDDIFDSLDSLSLDEILKKLSNGTKLYKIRSSRNIYRRHYSLDTANKRLKYFPSNKSLFCSNKPYLDLDSIDEVRQGWNTDVFNAVEAEKRRRKRRRDIDINESCCFSLILTQTHETVDLLAACKPVRDAWVKALGHLVACHKNLQKEEEHDRWLKEQFRKADTNDNGSLNFNECLSLLKQLNISMDKKHAKALFNAANFNKNKIEGEDALDQEEFVKFYHNLVSRPDIERLFKKYTVQNASVMGREDLQRFLKNEQKMDASELDCKIIIERYAKNEETEYITSTGFREMLLSEDHNIFNRNHLTVFQDMDQPLNHYYIASSHNTYLLQDQLVGESSVEGYISALSKGCRCIELDVWDGPHDEPVVYHGYTLTSKILFRDILDAVKQYAFKVSQYPVILSLETHCSVEQQKIMAKNLLDILGDLLYKETVKEDENQFPSPGSLSGKILVKGKKLNKDFSVDQDESDEDSNSKEKSVKKPTEKSVLAEELSELVTYCKATSFKDFQQTEEWKFYEMASFSESKAEGFISEEETARSLIKYNSEHLSRIYPKGTRTSSSNYNPVPFWNSGCQLVALNYQKLDQKTFLNEAKFSQNGRCGYILMPTFLRNGTFNPFQVDPSMKKVLVISVISGQHIPKPQEATEGEVIDPYVVIKIIGHPSDKQKVKTKYVHNNGFNPEWNETFQLMINVPELAMVVFTVKDESRTGKNLKLGKYALPFTSITEGYRHVQLRTQNFNPITMASLFVHIEIR